MSARRVHDSAASRAVITGLCLEDRLVAKGPAKKEMATSQQPFTVVNVFEGIDLTPQIGSKSVFRVRPSGLARACEDR